MRRALRLDQRFTQPVEITEEVFLAEETWLAIVAAANGCGHVGPHPGERRCRSGRGSDVEAVGDFGRVILRKCFDRGLHVQYPSIVAPYVAQGIFLQPRILAMPKSGASAEYCHARIF